jgi:hypothetical protein
VPQFVRVHDAAFDAHDGAMGGHLFARPFSHERRELLRNLCEQLPDRRPPGPG